MKFDLIVSDPPWHFSDSLKMSKTKRGAAANYSLLKNKDIINLDVKSIASENSILVLWVPSSLLKEGIETMENWGFTLKQTHVWVKIKKNPLINLINSFKMSFNLLPKGEHFIDEMKSFDLSSVLSFYMGRIFRQTHEIALIGTRGKVSDLLKDKSQRSVHFATVNKHSEKPEILQDMLDKMYPGAKKLEMFARRDRVGYTCVGNESTLTKNEDIRDSISKLQKVKSIEVVKNKEKITLNNGKICKDWSKIPI